MCGSALSGYGSALLEDENTLSRCRIFLQDVGVPFQCVRVPFQGTGVPCLEEEIPC